MIGKAIVWVIVVLIVLALAIWGFSSLNNEDSGTDGGGAVNGGDVGTNAGGDLIGGEIIDDNDSIDLGDVI
jgi:hypothetical protein